MSPDPFKTGGPLSAEDAEIYIQRQADAEVLTHLRKMDYILLIEPRQQGKTSLLARLKATLESTQYVFGYVDISNLSYENEQAWLTGLRNELHIYFPSVLKNVRSVLPKSCQEWHDNLSAIAQLAHENSLQVVIALDEVGRMANVGWAESFFNDLRTVYIQRAFMPTWKRVTFILSGAFHPRNLITDDKISPFNIAQRVRLSDFTLDQVRELVSKGNWPAEQTGALAERIHYWADGQPYLTQLLCSYLGPEATLEDVDAGVERLRREDENHLPPILERLRVDEKLCEYVVSVQAGKRIKFSPRENPRQTLLELLGIIKADDEGCCKIRNRIYEQALAELEVPSAPKAVSVPASHESRYDVFISYSHKNILWVRYTLLPRLEQAGLRVCIDDRDFEIGVPSLVNMERAVDRSRHTLLVLTPAWVESEWTEFESLLAGTTDPAGRRQKLIPLMLEPCKPPPRIAMLTYVDFAESGDQAEQFNRLVKQLRTDLPEIDLSLEVGQAIGAPSQPRLERRLE